MNLEQRVFHASTDISTKVNDYRTGAHTFAYTTGQYLYVGSILPFNNLWFEMGTLNVVAATASVQIWWANAWHDAVDLIDTTSGLTVNGRLMWNTDAQKGWDREQYSSDVTGLPAASKIYDMYWARIAWSANLTAGTTLKYIGQKFAEDDILYSFYPDLNNTQIRESYETGKTTWDEQHYMAAEHIVRDLKKRNIIKSRSQILDFALLTDAACHKVAELVYTAFGAPYFDQLKDARAAYREAMNVQFFNVDQNADGALSFSERKTSQSFLSR